MESTVGENPQQSLKLEVKSMADLISGLNSACTTKCLPRRYHLDSLTASESACLDQCAMKYIGVCKLVRVVMAEQNQQVA